MIKIFKPKSFDKDNLRNVYDVCNKIFKDKECFYTSEEIKVLKKDKSNIFVS